MKSIERASSGYF